MNEALRLRTSCQGGIGVKFYRLQGEDERRFGGGRPDDCGPPDDCGQRRNGARGRAVPRARKYGRKSLHGIFTRNFPNMGVISGLKQAGITWSITFMNRRQAEHFVAVVKRCLDEGVDSFDVTADAEQRWIGVLQEKTMKDTTWHCQSKCTAR